MPDSRAMTMSLEDYLECIYMLILSKRPARVRDIAASLGVKTPSVVNAIKQLAALGFVSHEPYASVDLTPAGRSRAVAILARHEILTRFLEALQVPADVAEADACRMEHILSPETYAAIDRFLAARKVGSKPKRKLTAQKK